MTLPQGVDESKISARFDGGVLEGKSQARRPYRSRSASRSKPATKVRARYLRRLGDRVARLRGEPGPQ